MNIEHQTSVVIFSSLANVMRVLRRSAIVLEKMHGIQRVTLDALPVFTDRPPAFTFILDAELATVTPHGPTALKLRISIELSGENAYVADARIGWDTVDDLATSHIEDIECPEVQDAEARAFFEHVLPNYAKELVARHKMCCDATWRTPPRHLELAWE